MLNDLNAEDEHTDKERLQLLEDAFSLENFNKTNLSPTERLKLTAETTGALVKFLENRADTFCGYQCNQAEHYQKRLAPFLDLHVNNIGDPFSDIGGFRINNKSAERAILRYYSQLWIGKPDESPTALQPSRRGITTYTKESMDSEFFHEATGYVCSFGSTEGNLWALRQARDYLKGKFLFGQIYGEETDDPHVNEFGPLATFGSATTVHLHRHDKYHASAALIPTQKHAEKESTIPNPVGPHQSVDVQIFPALEHHNPSDVNKDPLKEELIPLLPPEFPFQAQYREPILLYSDTSHYSISKIKDMLEIHTPDTFIHTHYYDYNEPDKILRPSQCFEFLQKNSVLTAADKLLTPENFIRLFGKDEFPHLLPSYEDGTLNTDALAFMVRFFFSLGNPVIIGLNYGTTFTGAHDNPQLANDVIVNTPGCHLEEEKLVEIDGKEYTSIRRRNYYVHCDGALGAAYGPFWDEEKKEGNIELLMEFINKYGQDPLVLKYLERIISCGQILQGGDGKPEKLSTEDIMKQIEKYQSISPQQIALPSFNLRRSCVNSVAMSGHKFIGSPCPSGCVMSIRKYGLDFVGGSSVSYISSPDTTVSGSRSGLNVMVFYDYLSRHGPMMDGLKYWALYNNARFAANHIASMIGTQVLSVARDKPIDFWVSPLDDDLYEEQKKQTGTFRPLVRNFPGSLSIIFPQPSYEIQDKYSLSCDVVKLPKKYGYNFDPNYLKDSKILTFNEQTQTYTLRCAHIFSMESLTIKNIMSLAHDVGKDPQITNLLKAMIE
jgi:hypothetical protein